MALIAVTDVVPTGVQESLSAAAGGGDEFVNEGNTMFIVNNGDVSAKTVTFDSPNADNFGVTDASHDAVKSIPAGETHIFGPFRKDQFNDANGRVQVSYSAVTSVTVGAFKFQGKN